jgi:hypothetical protein
MPGPTRLWAPRAIGRELTAADWVSRAKPGLSHVVASQEVACVQLTAGRKRSLRCCRVSTPVESWTVSAGRKLDTLTLLVAR